MSKKVWGPITWRFLHTMCAKIRPEYFEVQRENLIHLIKSVCETLPCPECRAHAVSNMKSANTNYIVSKDRLIDFMYEFHNMVNSQTKKQKFPREILQQYEEAKTIDVVNQFAEAYSKSAGNNKLMTDTFHRRRFLGWLKSYITSNGGCFSA